MAAWTVEIDDRLLNEVEHWPRDLQKELYALQLRLRAGGPEAMGLIKADLEGVPAWEHLSGSVSLWLPLDLPSGWKVLAITVQPDWTLIITGLE